MKIKFKHTLFLASSSEARKTLLEECKIPFEIVPQKADEASTDWTLPIEQLVLQITRLKMDNAVLPEGKEGDICFVLTADTLSQDKKGNVQGKPIDRYDAIDKLINP